jgi:hypothetical protein
MGKRGRVFIAVAAIAVLAVLAWTMLHAPAPEPVYNGKPLSYWLQAYNPAQNGNQPTEAEANAAINEIGTNAIPTLLRMLRAHDSPLKTKIIKWVLHHHLFRTHYTSAVFLNSQATSGIEVLGPAAAIAVPELIKIVNENVSASSQSSAASSLGYIGPEAKEAVPSLLHATTSSNQNVRSAVLIALGQIHEDADAVVPVLTKALHDPSTENRAIAAVCLAVYQGAAKSAVPALVALLNDPNANSNSAPTSITYPLDVHTEVEAAIREIDPETYARVVTNAPPIAAP